MDQKGQVFWAKTSDINHAHPYKSVAHHLADVAAMALVFHELNPNRLRRDSVLSGLAKPDHAKLCALLAGLHDLGKISRSFQCQQPDLWPRSLLGPLPSAVPQSLKHWEATAILLKVGPVKAALAPVFGRDGLDAQTVAAVAGHHGRPPSQVIMDANEWTAQRHPEIGQQCVDAAAQLCEELISLLPGLRDLPPLAEPEAFSFAMNGLITLADWIGSDGAFFINEPPGMRLEDYWPLAQQRATAALKAKGLLPARGASLISLSTISGQFHPPRPMQQVALELQLKGEPQIVIIEDGTGSGKTEAALLLAQRMMQHGLGEGLFVALPTMATANAMHRRLETAMPGLFEGNASLVLAHGKTAIATALEQLSVRADGSEEDSGTACWFNAWIADSRKKAFFADAGACTIDQAFLSILPKKHLTMRQYALAGRILIVDEAHACDAYMGEELKTLVEMQARLGGSVIILSATLGRAMRVELVKAFAIGRGLHPSKYKSTIVSIGSEAYPLLTRWCSASGVEEIAVPADPAMARRVGISRIEARSDAVAAACEAARRGAAVAIICNAVDAAIETWSAVLAAGHDPKRCHLFHARFTMDDRLSIERQVQAWFGRSSTAEDRAGRILVATQVIEQSLDVDFDLMISDLAPVDLLIQRAGRLWRHKRETRPLPHAHMHILSPEPAAAVKEDWLKDVLGQASYVYQMPGVMWRSARDLLAKGSLETPLGLRYLIETAYAASVDDLPEDLRVGHDTSVGADYAKRALGQHNTIKPENGYMALASVSADEDFGTRLGERSLTIRLARREGGTLVPLCNREGAGDALNWALSEVIARDRWFKRSNSGVNLEPPDLELATNVRSNWSEWEQEIPLFEADEDGTLIGTTLIYSSLSGLCSKERNK